MSKNGEILKRIIDEDFRISGKGRWYRSDEHSSLVLDYEKGVFYFNAEGIAGDPFTYLTKVRGYDFDRAKNYLKSFENYSDTFVYTINAGKDDIVVYPKLVEIFFDLGRCKERREYLYYRGINDETIDRFQIGWYNDYTMIPFFENGTFRNFQKRQDSPKKIRQYYRGVGPLLFNSDTLKLTNRIFYTEGPVDALILIQNGIPAISSNSGEAFLPEWLEKFIYQSEIFLVFDNDKAGTDGVKKISKFLGLNRCKCYCFQEFEESGYDPVDYFRDGHNKDDFMELIETKSKYSFEM